MGLLAMDTKGLDFVHNSNCFLSMFFKFSLRFTALIVRVDLGVSPVMVNDARL